MKHTNSVSTSISFLYHRCLRWSPHGWEQHVSNSWNCCLETKIYSVINCLWANYSSLLGVQFEATNDTCCLIFINIVKEFSINNNIAWNFISLFASENLDLRNNHLLIFSNCFSLNFFDQSFILLSASDKNLSLHKLNQAL